MSTIKISQLQQINQLEANTSNTLLVGVDTTLGVTGKITVTTLAQGLYSNNALVVGSNPILFPNTIGQFSGSDPNYTQLNIQNFNSNGASDLILTADTGTNSNSYIDLGINNSKWNSSVYGQTSQYPYDGYLIVQGPGTSIQGNLVIGTAVANTSLVFAVGGQFQNNIVARVTSSGISLNTAMSLVFGDGTSQISAGSSVANTIYLQTLNNNQNTSVASVNTYANSAYNKANTALQNTANILISGNVTFAGANTYFNSNIVTYGTMTTTGNVVTTGNLTATGPTVFTGNVTINGSSVNYGNTVNYGNLTTTGNVVTVGNLTATGPITFNGNFVNNGTTINNGQTTLNGNTTTTGNFIMTNSTFAANSYAIAIIGSSSGQTQAPIADGTMLQLTGKDNVNSKLIVDAAGAGVYSLFQGRSMRGLANTPSALLSGDIMVKFGGNGYGTTGFGSNVNVGGAYMQYVAAENYSDTNKGTNIVFGTTPTGSNTITTVLTLTANTAYFANNVMVANTETVNTLVANTIVFGSATANSMVTQQTSKSTSVTANGTSGQITMNSAQLTHATEVVFTVNNSYVQHVNDIPIVAIQNPITAGQYIASVAAVRVGSFDIMIANLGAGPAQDKSDAIILNWALLRVGS